MISFPPYFSSPLILSFISLPDPLPSYSLLPVVSLSHALPFRLPPPLLFYLFLSSPFYLLFHSFTNFHPFHFLKLFHALLLIIILKLSQSCSNNSTVAATSCLSRNYANHRKHDNQYPIHDHHELQNSIMLIK